MIDCQARKHEPRMNRFRLRNITKIRRHIAWRPREIDAISTVVHAPLSTSRSAEASKRVSEQRSKMELIKEASEQRSEQTIGCSNEQSG